jgi:hypothetical protein
LKKNTSRFSQTKGLGPILNSGGKRPNLVGGLKFSLIKIKQLLVWNNIS